MRFERVISRVLLAPIFLYGGWDVLKNPAPRVKVAQEAGAPSPDMTVRANATLMVGAGTLLLLGIVPRLAAALLAASLVPTSLAGHQFWKKEGPERKQQMTQFLKNAAAVGGLLLFALQPDEQCQVVVVEEE